MVVGQKVAHHVQLCHTGAWNVLLNELFDEIDNYIA